VLDSGTYTKAPCPMVDEARDICWRIIWPPETAIASFKKRTVISARSPGLKPAVLAEIRPRAVL